MTRMCLCSSGEHEDDDAEEGPLRTPRNTAAESPRENDVVVPTGNLHAIQELQDQIISLSEDIRLQHLRFGVTEAYLKLAVSQARAVSEHAIQVNEHLCHQIVELEGRVERLKFERAEATSPHREEPSSTAIIASPPAVSSC